MMIEELDYRERLRLLEFACMFAWADFEIAPQERAFISRLVHGLEIDEADQLKSKVRSSSMNSRLRS